MTSTIAFEARVDRDCRLLSADAALLALQQAAGGVLGGPIVIPQISRFAHMALRRGRPMSRRVTVADNHSSYAATLDIHPDEAGARLALRDFTALPTVSDAPAATGSGIAVPAPIGDGWHWESDPQLRLVALKSTGGAPVFDRAAWAGQPLSRLFNLKPDDDGQFPLLLALAGQNPFAGQQVTVPARGDTTAGTGTLAGQPLFDAAGGFRGFAGTILINPAVASDAPAGPGPLLPMGDPVFGRRIDGALRGPLTSIIATAETISGQLNGPIRQDYARYASDIADAGRHLLGLINDLADLQMIERPGFSAAREAVDLADIARRAAGLLAMKAEERGIGIDLPAAGEVVLATAEFRRVLQIMLNLVGNAITYSPEGSAIRISVTRDGDRALVSVADQGQGIGTADQDRVFDKFERLGRSDSGGSGLGLYISQRLARAMDGAISIDSTPGEGARFTLSLPAREPKRKTARPG